MCKQNLITYHSLEISYYIHVVFSEIQENTHKKHKIGPVMQNKPVF